MQRSVIIVVISTVTVVISTATVVISTVTVVISTATVVISTEGRNHAGDSSHAFGMTQAAFSAQRFSEG